MYTSVTGGLMQEKRMAVLANNLANVNTTAFKRDVAVFQTYIDNAEKKNAIPGSAGTEFDAPAVLRGMAKDGGKNETMATTTRPAEYANRPTQNSKVAPPFKLPQENVFVNDSIIKTDHKQGALQPTGNPLDIAIDGKGFFTFKTASGIMYSRNGALKVNVDGQLSDANGNLLLKQNGDPISVATKEGSLVGVMISQKGEVVGKLPNAPEQSVSAGIIKMAQFEDPAMLEKVGDNLFSNAKGLAKEVLPKEMNSKVVQGSLELANVNIVREMVEMISATRGYQSMQKVIQSIDGATQKSVNQLGRPI